MVQPPPFHLCLCFWSDLSIRQTVQYWVSVLLAVYGAALVIGSRTVESISSFPTLRETDLRLSHMWLFGG